MRHVPCACTAEIVCGKWTLLLVRDLAEGRSRFCELERSLAGISPRTLSLRLRALEEEGIVERHTFPEVPPRVEYALTEKGRALLPIIDDMRAYGEGWLGARVRRARRSSRPRRRSPALAAADRVDAATAAAPGRSAGGEGEVSRTHAFCGSSLRSGRPQRVRPSGGRTCCRPTSPPARRSRSSWSSRSGSAGVRGTPLYCYRPLTGRVHRRAPSRALRRLPGHAARPSTRSRGFDGLDRYLAGAPARRAGARDMRRARARRARRRARC